MTSTKVDAKLELLRTHLIHEIEDTERRLATSRDADQTQLDQLRAGYRERIAALRFAIQKLDYVQERCK